MTAPPDIAPADATSSAPGELLEGRFVLRRELGRGGMGSVWAATHTVTGRSFAIKLLHERRAHEAGAAARLLREARASCAATHPTILPVDDVLSLPDGRHALVMELLEGESLRACLDRERLLPVDRVAAIFGPVIDGLAAAHAAGIVHRDLKPDNIFLVAGDPPVRILDFGIAQSTLDEAPSLTSTGAMLGTPYYMAPEQAFGEGTKGAATDVWSLGVVLFECLAGKRPTQAANLGQVLRLMSEERLPKLERAGLAIAPRLAQTVDRMLSRDPAARPSLDEVRVAFTGTSEAPPPEATTSKRSPRALAFGALASAILLLAALSFAALGRQHHTDTPALAAPRVDVRAELAPSASLSTTPNAPLSAHAPAIAPSPRWAALPTSTASSPVSATASAAPSGTLKTAPRTAPSIVEEPPF